MIDSRLSPPSSFISASVALFGDGNLLCDDLDLLFRPEFSDLSWRSLSLDLDCDLDSRSVGSDLDRDPVLDLKRDRVF